MIGSDVIVMLTISEGSYTQEWGMATSISQPFTTSISQPLTMMLETHKNTPKLVFAVLRSILCQDRDHYQRLRNRQSFFFFFGGGGGGGGSMLLLCIVI